MRVKVIITGYGEVSLEGNPREVLKKVDDLVVRWKVMWDGKETG